jgi:hypothetical protein
VYFNLALGFLAASLGLLVTESLGIFAAANLRKFFFMAGLACVLLEFLKSRETAAKADRDTTSRRDSARPS